jgi:hypothetical protein
MHETVANHIAERIANAPDNTPKLRQEDAEKAQIALPEVVDVPLPKEPSEEIAVPASINGRDLSRGGP